MQQVLKPYIEVQISLDKATLNPCGMRGQRSMGQIIFPLHTTGVLTTFSVVRLVDLEDE